MYCINPKSVQEMQSEIKAVVEEIISAVTYFLGLPCLLFNTILKHRKKWKKTHFKDGIVKILLLLCDSLHWNRAFSVLLGQMVSPVAWWIKLFQSITEQHKNANILSMIRIQT
jgi:predicted permease